VRPNNPEQSGIDPGYNPEIAVRIERRMCGKWPAAHPRQTKKMINPGFGGVIGSSERLPGDPIVEVVRMRVAVVLGLGRQIEELRRAAVAPNMSSGGMDQNRRIPQPQPRDDYELAA